VTERTRTTRDRQPRGHDITSRHQPLPLVLAAAAFLLTGCAAQAPPRPTASPGEISAPVRPEAAPRPGSFATTRESWQFAAFPGTVIVTPHYRIHTTIANERILERMPLFLECAMHEYTTSLAHLPGPSRRLDTYVFRDRRQWSAKTRLLLPEQAGAFQNLGRGGYATRGTSVLYYIDWAGRDRDTFAIAAHEGWHQYTQSTFRNPLPIWLEEGIATYMEGYRFRRNDQVPEFEPARNWERRRELADAVRGRRLIPLAELLRETPQTFLAEGKNRLLTYYAQVWALTRFLAEDETHRGALADVLYDAASGRLVTELMRSPAVLANGGRTKAFNSRIGPWVILGYFNDDLTAFEQAYLDYVHRIAG
jgi:hypothetical protein